MKTKNQNHKFQDSNKAQKTLKLIKKLLIQSKINRKQVLVVWVAWEEDWVRQYNYLQFYLQYKANKN